MDNIKNNKPFYNMENKKINKKIKKGEKQMVELTLFTNVLTNFYFSQYLFIAGAVYGVMRLLKMLIINK